MLNAALLAPQKVGNLRVLVGVEFLPVFSFLFDQLRVVLTVVRVLFFENTMHPTSVFFINMCMIDLGITIGVITSEKLR